MLKKKFFSFGVMIVLIIACIVLIFTLFILLSVPAVDNIVPGPDLSGGAEVAEDENLPPPLVEVWDLPLVASVTGSDSATGLAAAWGFDQGIKAINEMGGIRGLPVAITLRDTASSVAEVTTEIEMLTLDSLVIMGPPVESAFKAGVPVFYDVGLPAVGAATDEKNRDAHSPYAVSCITDPRITAESVVAAWLQTETFTKVCIICAPISSERVDVIEEELVNAGIEIERIEVGNEAFDAATIADKAFSSAADAYYFDTTGEDIFRIVTQLRFIAGDGAGNLTILCGPLAADKELLDSAEGSNVYDVYGVRVWTTIDPGKDVEKRKAFNETFEKSVGGLEYHSLAVDYFQAAIMLKQGIETLALTREPGAIKDERLSLANWLFNSESIHTEFGDFFVAEGGKALETKFYTITEKGFH